MNLLVACKTTQDSYVLPQEARLAQEHKQRIIFIMSGTLIKK